MCFTDWMTLDDDSGDGAELLCTEKEHLWKKGELKVHFMTDIKGCRKEDGNFLSTGDVLDIANDWHRCGQEIVPKFVLCREGETSDIRVTFTGIYVYYIYMSTL